MAEIMEARELIDDAENEDGMAVEDLIKRNNGAQTVLCYNIEIDSLCRRNATKYRTTKDVNRKKGLASSQGGRYSSAIPARHR